MSPSPEQLKAAEEAAKEAYFDLTTHPSEAGPKGAALLDEYLRVVVPRIASALLAARKDERKKVWKKAVEAVPEVNNSGNGWTEKAWADAVSLGSNVNAGWNAARATLLSQAAEEGIDVKPDLRA